jgi:hypothetical protein
MSYVSPAERERQRWMTLKEAISHIQRVDGCDEVIAFAQLRRALADGAIEARWGPDEFSPRLFEIQPGRRIRLATFWRTVPIDGEGGFIPGVYPEDLPDADPDIEDNSPEQYMPKRYYLFVLRDSISRHWASFDPENAVKSQSPPADVREAVFEEAAAADIQATVIKEATGSRNREYASEPQIRETAVQIYDEHAKAGAKPPNMPEAFDLIAKRLAPKLAPKRRVFPVLREDEFKNRRWKPGKHSTKK